MRAYLGFRPKISQGTPVKAASVRLNRRRTSVRNNFFISYDLMRPDQNYGAVQEAIKSLGHWYKFQYSLFYVNTTYTAEDCDVIIGRAMDANDRLLIADSRFAVVRGISEADIEAINRVWLATPATYAA